MLEQLAYLADIVGVILIVASLVYVARQLRQNTEMLRSGSRQALLSNDHASLILALEQADLFERLSHPGKLTFQEQWKLSVILIMEMRNREHEFFQYNSGVLDEEAWLSYREIIRASLGNERGRKWWNTIGSRFYDPSFRAMVDGMLADTPIEDLRSPFGTWD